MAIITTNDAAVARGAVATFDGSSSRGPSGEPLSFAWAVRERPARARALPSPLTGPSTTLTPDQEGEWVVELVVTAGALVSKPATAVLTVSRGVNKPPTANLVVRNSGFGFVELDGSGSSDDDGDALTFSWRVKRESPGSALVLGTEAAFRTSVKISGEYEFELQVDDGHGGNDVATLELRLIGAGNEEQPYDAGPFNFDVLNPDELYVLGTVVEGTAGRDALAHWSTPNLAAAGFGDYVQDESAMIRPTDGRLLYFETFTWELKAFVCDTCPVKNIGPFPQSAANDLAVPTACAPMTLRDFKVGPDGKVWSQCGITNQTPWSAPPGETAPVSMTNLVAVGDGFLLTGSDFVVLDGGVVVPHRVPNVVAARWKPPTSFFVASFDVPSTTTTLWEVSVDGGVQLGVFPPPPTGIVEQGHATLNPRGELFNFGTEPLPSTNDVIFRRSINGGATIVYSESANPLVKLHISDLVTGP